MRLHLLPGAAAALLLSLGTYSEWGWHAFPVENPGFPKDGTWDVRWENLEPMP